MSWLQKMAHKKAKVRKKEKQATLPKPPKTYNGSKPIIGNFKPIFKKANEI